jgi:hypothetical protein
VIRLDKHVSLGYRYFRQGWIVDLGCGLENFGPLPPSCKLLGIEISNRIVADARPIFESRGGRIIHADVLSGLQSLETASCDEALVGSYLDTRYSRQKCCENCRVSCRERDYPQVAELR